MISRIFLYRHLCHALRRWVMPYYMREEVLQEMNHWAIWNGGAEISIKHWFHGASRGEWESLISYIESVVDPGDRIVMSYFSPSAQSLVAELRGTLEKKGIEVQFAGYCPFEGDWRRALHFFKPTVFSTAKYEAWPELWASLSELSIPLVVLGALPRPSLFWAKRILRFLGQALPAILFFCFDKGSAAVLGREFKAARIELCFDPRWKRIADRQRRKQKLDVQYNFGQARVTLGQIWLSDLDVIGAAIAKIETQLVVVPHELTQLSSIEQRLLELGLRPIRLSNLNKFAPIKKPQAMGRECIVVDQFGVLPHFYEGSDWVYVGGGFERGVHNTMEPAFCGVPIVCGPKRARFFPEVAYLKELGQLHLVSNSTDFAQFLKTVEGSGKFRSSFDHRQLALDQDFKKILAQTFVEAKLFPRS